jgi:hypothetical protein
LPDISTVNGIDASTLASFSGITVEDGQTVDGQTFAFAAEAHTLISSTTISSSTTNVSITSGLDSTYDMYEIHWKNVHPSSSISFQFQANAVGQTGFNEYMNTTFWYNYTGSHAYSTGSDQGGTSSAPRNRVYQTIGGALHTYPSSSTSGILVTDRKHFWATSVYPRDNSSLFVYGYFVAGHFYSTIDELDFKFDSGNIDAGQIDLYGVSTS